MTTVSIEPVLVRDLPDIASAADRHPDEYLVIPISPERAAAQARNPVALADDVGMFLLRKNGQCVGYWGLVPLRVWAGGSLCRVNMSSSGFIDPPHRGTGLAARAVPRLPDAREDGRAEPSPYRESRHGRASP